MDYYDIKITKNRIYYSANGVELSRPNVLSLKKLEEDLKSIKFNHYYNSIGGKMARSEELENLMIPSIAYTYYTLLVKHMCIPSIYFLVESYMEAYCDMIDDETFSFKPGILPGKHVFKKKHLAGKICRAYNSFNREVHFLILLQHIPTAYYKGLRFTYSFEKDYKDGVDIICTYHDREYAIATYFFSQKSKEMKEKKNTNRHDYSKYINLDVVAVFSGPERNVVDIGDVAVYNDDVAANLITTIIKKDSELKDEETVDNKEVEVTSTAWMTIPSGLDDEPFS